jgi:hypothetical protein
MTYFAPPMDPPLYRGRDLEDVVEDEGDIDDGIF